MYGWALSETLPYDEFEFGRNVKLEDILITPDDNDVGYFIEVDLIHPNNIKEKLKNFPFAPVNKNIEPNDFSGNRKKIKPDICTQTSKLICDWSDKKNYLIHYGMLKFYSIHGMIIDKVQDKISFRQSRWLEKYIFFITQKRNQVVNDFEKGFNKVLNNAFYGKTMEKVRKRIKIKIVKKDHYSDIINNNLN